MPQLTKIKVKIMSDNGARVFINNYEYDNDLYSNHDILLGWNIIYSDPASSWLVAGTNIIAAQV